MKRIFLIINLILVTSCQQIGQAKESLEFSDNNINEIQPEADEKVSFELLRAKVLDPHRCTVCHQWAADEDLVNLRITPGNPEQSRLYNIVKSGRMPIGGDAVPTKDLEVLELYIKNFNQKKGSI